MSSFLKILAYIVGTILTVMLLAIAFAPTVLSSSWGKAQILSYINRDINGGTASFTNLELSWSGPQKIEQFVLVDASGTPLVTVESFENNSSLLGLINKGFANGNISFKGFNAAITPNPSTGKTNLEEIIRKIIFPKTILNSICIKNGIGLLNFQDSSHIELKVAGQTQYGDIAGNFKVDLKKSEQRHQWMANIDQFPVAILDAIFTFQYPLMQGMLSNLLGDAIDIEVTETMVNDGINFNIRASSPIFSSCVSGKCESDNIVVTSPATIELTLTPDLLHILSNNKPKEWDLAEPVRVQLNLAHLTFPLTFFSDEGDKELASEWFLKSDLVIPKIVFTNLRHKELSATVSGLSLNMVSLPSTDKFTLRFMGNVAMVKDFVTFDLASSFPKPEHINELKNSLSVPSGIQVSVKDLPTILLDVLLGTNSWLTDTLGKEVSFRCASPQSDNRSLYLSLQSANLDVPDMLVQVDQKIRFDQDFTAHDLSGYIAADCLSFPGMKPVSSITGFRMPWNIKSDFQAFTGSFSGKILHKSGGTFDGSLSINQLSSDNSQIKFEFQGKHIPSTYLELFSGRTEITPLFGESLEISLEGNIKEMNGPLRGDVSGERGKIKLRSYLDKGVLKLNEPFEGEFVASPELGTEVLGKVVPLFKDLLSSQNPITITISTENFHFPLTSSDPRQVRIGKAVIDAGRMQFSNTGELQKLLRLLQASEVKEVTIWATPLFLSMDRGVLSLSRMDMLILDHYHLATWGQVDLAKDNVDLVIGITSEALNYALKIPSLNKGEMLQLPLKGKTRNTKIDQAKAASRIASILAKHQGGREGFVLGMALDIAGGKQPKVPHPTTNPLPWGDIQPQEPINLERGDTSHKKKNQIKIKS